MRTCPNCAEEIQGDTSASRCRYCGGPLPIDQEAAREEQVDHIRTRRSAWWALILAALWMPIGFVVFSFESAGVGVPLVLALPILTLVLGHSANRRMSHMKAEIAERRIARTAVLLSWFEVILLALGVAWVLMFVLGGGFNDV